MNSEIELPEEIVTEIMANRKVTAIKLLREHLGLDLKEAKEIVDSYLRENPATSTLKTPEADTGIGRILVLVIGVGIIYAAYRFLT